MLYRLEEIEGEREGVRVIYYDGQTICELRRGNTPLIALTFLNLTRQSEDQADLYMSGVVAGLIHSVLIKAVPKVAALPE